MRYLLILPLLLTGCATLGANPQHMTPEQIREWVKDKSGMVGCTSVSTPYKGTVVLLNVDKGMVMNGVLTIKDGCEVTYTNQASPPKP